jgi:hypothetical protein
MVWEWGVVFRSRIIIRNQVVVIARNEIIVWDLVVMQNEILVWDKLIMQDLVFMQNEILIWHEIIMQDLIVMQNEILIMLNFLGVKFISHNRKSQHWKKMHTMLPSSLNASFARLRHPAL